MNIKSLFRTLFLMISVGFAAGTMPALAATGIANSSNWAGYAATGGKFTTVAGTWTVPAVNNAARGSADTIWVGIGGVKSNDLIQAGTQATTDSTGQTIYEAWYEMLPQSVTSMPISINAGDSVTVSLAQQPDSRWMISFKDNTTNTTYQNNFTYGSSLTSAEWVVEVPSSRQGVISLDNFGSVQFNNCYAVKDGNTLTISQLGAGSITMLNGNKLALAVPSVLASGGSSFSVSRTSAVSTPNSRSSGRMAYGNRGRGYSRRFFGGFYWFRQ